MKMRNLIILSVCFAIVYSSLPPELVGPKCPRSSPGLEQCLLKAVERLKPHFKIGIPSINVPRLEPFNVRELDLDAELPGLKLKGEAINIVAYVASDFVIQSLKVDLDNYHMQVKIYIPKLTVTADYVTAGSKIFIIECSGSGQFKGAFNGITATLTSKRHAVRRNRHHYLILDDVIANISIENGNINVDPDKQFLKAKTAANYINASSQKLLKVVAPIVNKAAASIIMWYASKILNVVPLEHVLM